MAIRNYTSTVDPRESMRQIESTLVDYGARSFMTDYDDDGNASALAFVIVIDGYGVNFRLPANPEGMLEALKRDDDIRRSYCTIEQARRTVWRNLRDWVESQIALVEMNQVTIEQVFLPYAMTADGRTLADRMNEDPAPLLTN